MLKKISGYTTQFLFYVRNNFLSFLFKSSVFLTLLTLIYLVCILKHSNSVLRNPQIEVQQIARSQKLTLRIVNKTEANEKPARVDNFIPKKRINIGSHPYFPIQKQTASPITTPTTQATEATEEMPKTTETTTEAMTEDETTLPFFELPGDEDSVTLPSTMPVAEETTPSSFETHPLFPIQEQTTAMIDESVERQPEEDLFDLNQEVIETSSLLPSTCPSEETTETVAPFKRSLTLNELQFFETTTTLPEDEETTDGNRLTESTTASNDESEEISSELPDLTTELPEISNLFGVEREETELLSPAEDSSETEAETDPPENLFEDEENELEAHASETEADDDEKTQDADADEESEQETLSDQEALPDQETPSDQETTSDQSEEKSTNPFDIQNNLFNLFNFDHVPATSNIKTSRWTDSEGRQVSTISQLPEAADDTNTAPRFLSRLNRYQPLDSFMNMRIKDSVSLLERLFGNFLT